MTEAIYLLTGVVLGAGVGWVVGWVLGKNRAAPTDGRLEVELRGQLAQRESELVPLRSQLVEANKARAVAEANQSASQQMLAEQRASHEKATEEIRENQKKALADLRDA